MKDIWKEILFLLSWGISRLVTEMVCTPFLNGPVGNIVCFGKELIYDYTLLHFLFVTFKQSLIGALMREKRFFQRYSDHKQVSVTVLGANINLVAETVNCSTRGMMLVFAKHMGAFVKNGVILNIENELFRIVWGHCKGIQYQIGLQRQ